ncbi:MAG TPA: glycosyltransferase family 4 protein [Gemmatimonadaceae bacterium]|nr:glycosyltransferase family 4 protein [Gemmatimonadaceae bacterium]
MLRLLHCIYDDIGNPWVGGGGAHRVFEIYRRITDRVDATVATGNYPGARTERVDGVQYLRLGAPRPYPWSRLTYARAASQLLWREEYDAAIVDFSVYTPIRFPQARNIGLVVHMLHGPTARDRFGAALGLIVRTVEKNALRKARLVTTTSQWMKHQLAPLLTADARVEVIPAGAASEFSKVQRAERDYVLYYGRFDVFQKGIDTLLEAFCALASEFPRLRLILAGKGKDLSVLQLMVAQRGLSERIEIRSDATRNEVLDLFAGALFLVAPSRLEGLPMVPAEAMAAGVPVISTDVGAVSEVVSPPSGGMLVPPNDPVALANTMRTMLNDPAIRLSTSESARVIARKFDWNTVARRHLEFLEAIAANGAASRGRETS